MRAESGKSRQKKRRCCCWNLRYLNAEIRHYGYSFSVRSYIRYLMAVCLGIMVFSWLLGLKPAWILLVMVATVLFVPGVLVLAYRNLYEEKRFEDVGAYLEQLLYSFKRRAKILTALEETQLLFSREESVMAGVIEEAVTYIRTAHTNGDIYQEAFEIIEKEYGCKRLLKVHRVLRRVEQSGGDPDASLEILLQDRKMWIDRIYEMWQEKKNIKVKVTIGVGLSLLICVMSTWMLPEEFDVTGNFISQTVTAATLILNMLIWYLAQRWLSGSLLHAEEQEEAPGILKKYRYLKEADRKKQETKWRIMAGCFMAAVILAAVQGQIKAAVMLAGVAIWSAGGERRKYRSAVKAVSRQVEKQFPEWMMDMSLRLQTDNVHVSLRKTISEAPTILREELKMLVKKIEQQPNSLRPYLEFMKELRLPDVLSAMKILYSMAEFGTEDMRKQIEVLVQRNTVMLDKAERIRQEDRMSGVGFMILLPMVTGVLKMLVDLALVIYGILAVVNKV